MGSRERPSLRLAVILTVASVALVLALAVTHADPPRTCFHSGVYDYNVPVTDPVRIYTLSDGTAYMGTDPPPECAEDTPTPLPLFPEK
jgi:hypothetical protein